MSRLSFNIRLLDTNSDVSRKVLQELKRQFNDVIRRAVPNIQNRVIDGTLTAWKSHPTYISLVGGDLVGHFGFPEGNGQARADALLNAAASYISVESKGARIVNDNLDAGIRIYILRNNLDSIINSSEGNYIEYDKYRRSFRGRTVSIETVVLPWAEWLLKEGDRIIIGDYGILFGSHGRSGQAIMVKRRGGWRVPPEHAGTASNNWLTRSLEDESVGYEEFLNSVVQEEVYKAI